MTQYKISNEPSAEAKPGAKLDVSEIESCLDYTIGAVEATS